MNKQKALSSYKSLYLIRRLEEQLVQYYFDNKVMSFVHFYIGQEAVAVGVCENLKAEDRAFGNHRSHGHYLAKGGNPGRMVAELLGKVDGCCHGKGGSMHMIDKSVNFTGSTPILGSVAPIAAGSALTQKLKKETGITVAFYGDGASEEGVAYETVNFAALFDLPLLLVVENNLYSVQSKLNDRRHKNHNLETIVTGFGMKYFKANGNDFIDVFTKSQEATKYIRTENKPAMLECVVYRHMAHSAPICDDKAGYRNPDDNPDNRVANDSVKNFRAYLVEYLDFDDLHVKTIEADVETIVKQAMNFGINSPLPPQEDLMKDVYYDKN